MNIKKIIRPLCIILIMMLSVIFFLSTLGTVAYAAGLVDDTVNTANLYSKYPLTNYQLDFYVDNSWAWLPWNWGDGIGKSVMYGLYCITNFIWIISLYLSNATGYVVQQAYTLDFINDTADEIGRNIQTLAGVTTQGFSREGFYVGFLLILILVIGVYVAYTGLLKRETSKAIRAVINFVVVFVLSATFIAYAPSYIKNINDFSSDISTAALDLGTKLVIPDSGSTGKNSVDMIRNSLFSIQIRQPWLLLQYGDSSMDSIGADRAEKLLSTSPKTNDGKDREEVVKKEIEERGNTNLTLSEVMNRLGMVFFLLIFNLGITIFVFLLTGIMIFSQILFILYAMFLPISFLLSMIPTYEGMAKKAIVKLFNTIMMRAGITLVITIAFSISTMFYNLSGGYPFFMIAFLQIVTFAGIYFKLGELMSMFSLQANDSQNIGRKIFRKPAMFMRQNARRLERRIGRSFSAGSKEKTGRGSTGAAVRNTKITASKATQAVGSKQTSRPVSSPGNRVGTAIGAALDTQNRIKDKAVQVKENVQNIPIQAAYALHTTQDAVRGNISDMKQGIVTEREKRQNQRNAVKQKQHEYIAEKQKKLKQAASSKQSKASTTTARGTATSPELHSYVNTAKKTTVQPIGKERPEVISQSSGSTDKPVSPVQHPANEKCLVDSPKGKNKNTRNRESAGQHCSDISTQAKSEKGHSGDSPVSKERRIVSARYHSTEDNKTANKKQTDTIKNPYMVNNKTRNTTTVNVARVQQMKQKKAVIAQKGDKKGRKK